MNMQRFAGLTAAATVTGILTLAGAAEAATISFSDSLDFKNTDFDREILSLQQFDASLGTLTKVTLAFSSSIQGDAKVESEDNQATEVTFNLGGSLTLVDETNTLPNPIFDVEVSESASEFVAASDGVFDFAGPSGTEFEGLVASTSGEEVYTDADLLSFFTGDGNVDFAFAAIANSQVNGAGNIISQIRTQANAGITLTYDYEAAEQPESVPEPSALLGLGAVLLAGGLTFRKHGNVLADKTAE